MVCSCVPGRVICGEHSGPLSLHYTEREVDAARSPASRDALLTTSRATPPSGRIPRQTPCLERAGPPHASAGPIPGAPHPPLPSPARVTGGRYHRPDVTLAATRPPYTRHRSPRQTPWRFPLPRTTLQPHHLVIPSAALTGCSHLHHTPPPSHSQQTCHIPPHRPTLPLRCDSNPHASAQITPRTGPSTPVRSSCSPSRPEPPNSAHRPCHHSDLTPLASKLQTLPHQFPTSLPSSMPPLHRTGPERRDAGQLNHFFLVPKRPNPDASATPHPPVCSRDTDALLEYQVCNVQHIHHKPTCTLERNLGQGSQLRPQMHESGVNKHTLAHAYTKQRPTFGFGVPPAFHGWLGAFFWLVAEFCFFDFLCYFVWIIVAIVVNIPRTK